MHKPTIDLTGKKFNRITFIRVLFQDKKNRYVWECSCDCGNTIIRISAPIKRGFVKSCGCLRRELTISKNLTHGLSNHRLFSIWRGMHERCYNKKNKSYKWYGEKGIAICKEWKTDFVSFYNWAIDNGYEENLTIDRKQNELNYQPDNCFFSTYEEQALTRSNVYQITHNGETHTLKYWADNFGISTYLAKKKLIPNNKTSEHGK